MFFQRKRGSKVTIYFYSKEKGRQQTIPRELTRHLDSEPDEVIEKWMDEFSEREGIQRLRARRRATSRADELSRLFEIHMEEHKTLRRPIEGTLAEYRQHFEGYILPYFVREHSEKNPKKWYVLTADFPMYLVGLETSNAYIKKICDTLIRFGNFLAQRQIIPAPFFVPRMRIGRRKAPLRRKLTPEQAISFATQCPEWALFLLISYFGSLRPEEAFALSKEDFITGSDARSKAKTYSRFQKYGLGSGLSIHIDKTIVGKEVQHLTKNHYATGVVNVWHIEGARMIADLLRSAPSGRLFPGPRHPLNRKYRKVVREITNLNAQDLRRSSANHLGKVIGLDPILLKDHMRHAVLETTMLYVRDPSEREEIAGQQNFDDVG